MPIFDFSPDFLKELTVWRRDFHQHPELLYDTHRTAARVAELLTDFGLDDVTTGIGRTGVVGTILGHNGGAGKVIGLRADMDALPLQEIPGKEWISKVDGKMHACGHDGHTTMLLGTAKYLAENRNFSGTVVVIFQPAEEGGAGAKAMIDDGLMTRWHIEEVYALHNLPDLPVGEFEICSGPIMASSDDFYLTIHAKGGHAAMPHEAVDPIFIGSQIVMALQTLVSRICDPLDAAVLSITTFQAGSATNIIPESATLSGTVRTLSPQAREIIQTRMKEVINSLCEAHNARANFTYEIGYPVTVNHPVQTELAVSVAAQVAESPDRVNNQMKPVMGAEDFSFMLEERPGAFIFAGNGDTASLHNPAYDFNDELTPYGCAYFINLVHAALGNER
ncbi:M20 aminoacylase family protein [Flexibacterium corallicola]|uniref:M20 aminoacylase family protein n=1 Tax=Flexibacterium corallicola TaxID=3037259 RepID=UPI00286FA970|nr:M20 aminoacylase family protein [Pseudovibrio sp. M1P-2-3]